MTKDKKTDEGKKEEKPDYTVEVTINEETKYTGPFDSIVVKDSEGHPAGKIYFNPQNKKLYKG